MLNPAPYSVSEVGLARKSSLRCPAACQGVLLGPHFQKERKPKRAEGEVGLSGVPGKTQPHPQGPLELGWPFRVTLSCSNGAGPPLACTHQSLAAGYCPGTGCGLGQRGSLQWKKFPKWLRAESGAGGITLSFPKGGLGSTTPSCAAVCQSVCVD